MLDAAQGSSASSLSAALLLAGRGRPLMVQRATLIADARVRGIVIVEVVHQSGRYLRGVACVRELALTGVIDAVMVPTLATLGRGEVALQVAAELTALGVRVLASDAPWLAECGDGLHHVAGWLLEQSRLRRSAQSKAALSRARASGAKTGGRPRKNIPTHALQLVAELGIGRAARELSVGESTLRRHVAAARASGQSESTGCAQSPASFWPSSPAPTGAHQ